MRLSKIQTDFKASRENDPVLTGFVLFGRAIVFTNLPRHEVRKYMLRCINLSDYPEFTQEEALEHFVRLSYLKCATS